MTLLSFYEVFYGDFMICIDPSIVIYETRLFFPGNISDFFEKDACVN